ncbi:XendoU domain containing protein [Trichuris trichiura]|uniref:XendoU domain containing protein n=1 Tax=Trichuris trichiura TaxID=36087 RepID=A0A077ZB53_TRITR|nr:XendoU domain containing protein [Trichuris trichiura]
MNMYEPKVGSPERTGRFKERKIDRFLNEVLKTEVMKLLRQFLRWCGLSTANSDENFRKWLKDYWFSEYARRRKVVDSSAFEHVFLGEMENGKVLGLHNWIRFAYLEARGALNYKGFLVERQDSVATIEFTWNGNGKPIGGMLLGSSPEFEMAAATICSLLRPGANKCKFFYKNCEVIFESHDITRHGKNFLSTSFPKAGKTCRLSQNLQQRQKPASGVPSLLGEMSISGKWKLQPLVALLLCFLMWRISSGREQQQATDHDIKKVVELMQKADVNAAGLNDTDFNYQQLRGTGSALKKLGLMRKVNGFKQNIFRFVSFVSKSYKSKPTVKAFLQLMNMFEPQIGAPERTGKLKAARINNFIDMVVKTKVMNLLKKFLQRFELLITESEDDFKEWLKNLWFAEYARRRKVIDSSAFEHVFVGEMEKGLVSGLHNWIRYGTLEASGHANYTGYTGKMSAAMATIGFTWNNKVKSTSSMFLGSSPEFDMAVATICSLLRPGRKKCKLVYKGCGIRFTSGHLERNGTRYLSTSFPEADKVCPEYTRAPELGTGHNETQIRKGKLDMGKKEKRGKEKQKPKNITDADLQEIIELMEEADINAAGPNDALFNYQQRSGKGNAPERFVTFISDGYLKKPTIEALINLTAMYQPQLGVAERTNQTKEEMIEHFLNFVLETRVMHLLKQVLRRRNILSTSSKSEFRGLLKKLWFTGYSRRENALDTSAFEHYFVGEVYEGKVSGLHNWIRFAVLEANGDIDYKGYFPEKTIVSIRQKDLETIVRELYDIDIRGTDPSKFKFNYGPSHQTVSGLHYWLTYGLLELNNKAKFEEYLGEINAPAAVIKYSLGYSTKPRGSFLLRTTAEFDLALYTICLVGRSAEGCRFMLGGCIIKLVVHRLAPHNQVTTAYPKEAICEEAKRE